MTLLVRVNNISWVNSERIKTVDILYKYERQVWEVTVELDSSEAFTFETAYTSSDKAEEAVIEFVRAINEYKSC